MESSIILHTTTHTPTRRETFATQKAVFTYSLAVTQQLTSLPFKNIIHRVTLVL